MGASRASRACASRCLGTKVTHSVVSHPPPSHAFAAPPTPENCAPVFAVIALGGTQYKVTLNDVIVAEKVKNIGVGETMNVPDVLLVGSVDRTWVGRPLVPGALVTMEVEEQTKDKKVIIFKKRRRKSSQRKQGFRREVTMLRVTGVKVPPADS
jgi:large subunit ribosomal protein L21